MGQDMTWLSNAGLDVKTGIDYTGGEDKYLSAVRRYYLNFGKNRDKVSECYDAKDFENYTIAVHSLKSNSKMIGALGLGDAFEALETAARNGDEAYIEAENGKTLLAYSELIASLKPIEELGEVIAADEISGDVARQTAKELLDALDDFDADLSMSLAQKLSGYPFRITQKSKLKEAVNFISDFMYDDAAELIKQIIPAIE